MNGALEILKSFALNPFSDMFSMLLITTNNILKMQIKQTGIIALLPIYVCWEKFPLSFFGKMPSIGLLDLGLESVADPGGGPRGPCLPPWPVKNRPKKDGHHMRRLIFLGPPPSEVSGSATVESPNQKN